jgi:hypothetical protein
LFGLAGPAKYGANNINTSLRLIYSLLFAMDSARPPSPSQLPTSSSKYHHPYFTPAEVEFLSAKQRGKLSQTQEDRIRQYACAEMEVIGARLGLYVVK